MRHRSLTRRVFTAVFGIWFSLLVAEPVRLHACPMHDGPMAQIAAAPAAVTADDPICSHGADSAAHAMPSHDRTSSGMPAEHGAHQCQCLGCCAGTAALALPAGPAINLLAGIEPMQVRRIDARDALRAPTRFAHALPFANGPPRA